MFILSNFLFFHSLIFSFSHFFILSFFHYFILSSPHLLERLFVLALDCVGAHFPVW